MKTTRRIFTLVLALMMVLSLSVTAFATETGTATIKIYNGSSLFDTLTVNAGTSVYHALEAAKADATHTAITAVAWTEVTGTPNTHTPHYALVGINSIVGRAGTADDLDGEAGFENVTEDDAVEGYDGYYLVDTNSGYHYVYVGYNWGYYSLGTTGTRTDIDVYMCDYYAGAGETIVISYAKSVADWTQPNPLGQ